MSEKALLEQMAREEALFQGEISSALDQALNSPKTQARADEINETCGGWPYEPTKEMLQLYQEVSDKTWKGMKNGYSNVDVTVAVNAPKGAAPSSSVTVKYQGAFKGGLSYMISDGDTISSVAKNVYGYESYANVIWEKNAGVLGSQCRQVPAGFGIEIPRIFVPEWKSPPKISCSVGTQQKAVKILYPTLEFNVEGKKSAKQVIKLPAFVIEITYELSGSLKAQKKGTIDASFNLRTYEASVGKSVGGIGGDFKADFKSGSTSADLTVSSPTVKGMNNMKTSFSLSKGTIKQTFGSKKVAFTKGDMTYEGELTVTAEIKIKPNATKVRSPVKSKPLTMSQKIGITLIVVGAVGIAAVTLIPSGGTSAPAAAKGAAVAIVALGVVGG